MHIRSHIYSACHRLRQVRLRELIRYYVFIRRRKPCDLYCVVKGLVEGKNGLEIGGPSGLFQDGLLPIYHLVKAIDNSQFSSHTLWQGEVREEKVHWAKRGRQYIVEGSTLDERMGPYDFVAASHVLEHTANPLKALGGWVKLLREEGALLLVVPHRAGTFDHRRPYTLFEHLLEDLRRDVSEGDLTHIPEVLALHDWKLDPGYGSREEFEKSVRDNLHTRRMHQHVFSIECLVAMMTFLNLKIAGVEVRLPHHIVLLAQKYMAAGRDKVRECNQRYLLPDAQWRKSNPFSRVYMS